MKAKLTIIALTLMLATAAWAESKAEMNERVGELITQFKSMQSDPETKVPPTILQQAQGIVILHSVKGGLVFGGEAGHGIGMVRDTKSGEWSPIAFVKTVKGSFGAQIGGQTSDKVFVLMNSAGTKLLLHPDMKIGGEAQGTFGPKSGGVETPKVPENVAVLVYVRREGAYGGASVEGGGFSPDDKANEAYYGKRGLTMDDILYRGEVKRTSDAEALAQLVKRYSTEETPAATSKE